MAFRQLLLIFIGLSAGGVIAAGIFAFLAMIGVLPRLVGVTGTKKQIRLYETMMILGGVGGVAADRYQNGLTEAFRCAASRLLLFAGAAGWGDGGAAVLRCLGQIFLGIFGLAAGIFCGKSCDVAGGNLKGASGSGTPPGACRKGPSLCDSFHRRGKTCRLPLLFFRVAFAFSGSVCFFGQHLPFRAALSFSGSLRRITEEFMEIDKKEYGEYVKKVTPVHSTARNILRAFVTGGAICLIGQALTELFLFLGAEKEAASAWTTLSLIGGSVLLTGLNLYPRLVKFGGAGALVPITGFANSVVAPAIECRAEGHVFGIGYKIFTIAGPVILFGIFSSWLLGLISWAGGAMGF